MDVTDEIRVRGLRRQRRKRLSMQGLRKEKSGCSYGCGNSRPELTPSDAKWPPDVLRIADAWPRLELYIRQAFSTLVDAALSSQKRQGGSHE